MQNLLRRPSGIYVVRLTVPERLRALVGKRELVATTGSRDLQLAKIVASTMLAQWRRRFFDLDRLAASNIPVNQDTIIKIAEGHPLLLTAGCMPLDHASAASGIDASALLRRAMDNHLTVFYRLGGVAGHLVPFEEFKVDDPEIGTRLVPHPHEMPERAQAHVAHGPLALPRDDAPSVIGALLAGADDVGVVVFESGRAGIAFVPGAVVQVRRDSLEVESLEVEALRKTLAATIEPTRLEAARSAQKAAMGMTQSRAGKHAEKRLSEALDAYSRTYLPQKITKAKEIERVRTGIGLLIDFEGDLPLDEIDLERLQRFRDDKLSTVLARENVVRVQHGTRSMTESIAAIAAKGIDWPIMSAAERDLRMQWIARMFQWLHDQKWIAENPASGLRGSSVLTKAEKGRVTSAKKPREEFTLDELKRIFSVSWFQTGRGELTSAGTYREFAPFRYWMPLLGLLAGCRIGELSQLWLSDVRSTPSGTWYIDINEKTQDKDLKNAWSARTVPLHPIFVELGFLSWCDRLRDAGFQRVFPELSWNDKVQYAKEPTRAHSTLFARLGMPRDNTKVFHSFRHNLNNYLEKNSAISDVARKRIMGHLPGEGVNERHYLSDRSPDETIAFLKAVDFQLPRIAAFDEEAGLKAVRNALDRKQGERRGTEDMGPLTRRSARAS